MIDNPPDGPPIGHSRDAKQQAERPLGAGSEAAEGIHAEGASFAPDSDTALDARKTGVSRRDGAERSGSEPLLESVMHTSGYGGEGGAPRRSADQREHLDADGTLESED